ncbi:MAG: AAA family ATPase [Blautia sp.]|uniref:AAA family ATPase n=1 Tax=Blautia sp. TaxID=1955243 RepID=UPI00262B65CE|nr:AAA family ATPase [Blautia sp.]MDD6414119.1 AAA family ATPase [Blautia sp.]
MAENDETRLTPEQRQTAIELIESAQRKWTTVKDGKIIPSKEFNPIRAVTAAELDKMEIPPIEWIVNGILPVGLSMIGAPSKYYKSYMALGLCVDICKGRKFLGFACEKSGCLYLDLESTKRRPKNRLDQILGSTESKPDNLYIITGTDNPGRIGDGFEAQIEYQLQEHPDIKLIIVDVFQMIRQPSKKNQTGYDRDYDDFRALKQIADQHNIGVMLIHHTRKMKDPSDVFNELSGSVGVMGALDCAWVITKDDRYSMEGTLHITGRDMESQKLKICFNKKTFQWEYVGTEEDVNNQRRVSSYNQSPIRETIVKLVNQGSGHWEGAADEIKQASKYFSWEIYDDVRKIGKFIKEYDDLFQGIDGIESEYIRVAGGKRKYLFNVTNANNVTNATQLSINDI